MLKDKCKTYQLITKKKPDGDEDENKETAEGNSEQLKLQIRDKERIDKGGNSERLRESQQKHRSLEMIAMSQVQSIN